MTNTVALIGAGAMGGAIGARLVETGHQVAVFDLDKEKMQDLVDKGARPSTSGAHAASLAETVILSLNSAAIVRRAVFGEDGVAAGAKAGTLIIDMSSIIPNPPRRWPRTRSKQACGGSIALSRAAPPKR